VLVPDVFSPKVECALGIGQIERIAIDGGRAF
jgi:hypothetical protein